MVRAALVVAAVAGVLVLWVAVSGSQLFEIERVDVVGVSSISSEAVIARAALGEGETLLRVDGDAIAARLLEDPWIKEASVQRRPPSTLRIEITERVPAAVVDTGVSFWFVESQGRVLTESVPSSATVVPVIRDIPDFVAEPGVTSESATLLNALDVLSGLSEELRSTVRSITAPSIDKTTLLTTTGVEIMVGEAVNMKEKSVIVGDILAAEGDRVVFIDVRSIERPISRKLGD
ncbi:MAG: FtsQ-type POTRA domain-containing protein [Coriobacteriia bacterium]|nr:FtsQ-type POTRA domain-containing protein [Coriobacteriia bacterium]